MTFSRSRALIWNFDSVLSVHLEFILKPNSSQLRIGAFGILKMQRNGRTDTVSAFQGGAAQEGASSASQRENRNPDGVAGVGRSA